MKMLPIEGPEKKVDLTLKPCPFCGGEAEWCGERDIIYAARCSECKARTGLNTTIMDALESWNKRVDNGV
jgi:Lar family restriction alleviation protein